MVSAKSLWHGCKKKLMVYFFSSKAPEKFRPQLQMTSERLEQLFIVSRLSFHKYGTSIGTPCNLYSGSVLVIFSQIWILLLQENRYSKFLSEMCGSGTFSWHRKKHFLILKPLVQTSSMNLKKIFIDVAYQFFFIPKSKVSITVLFFALHLIR